LSRTNISLHQHPASFDKLGMRSFLRGTYKMPFPILLILSLSKDAKQFCSIAAPLVARARAFD